MSSSEAQTMSQEDICFFCRSGYITRRHILLLKIRLRHKKTSASPADQATSQEDICFFWRSDYVTRRHLLLLKISQHHKKTSEEAYICFFFWWSDYVTRRHLLLLKIRLHDKKTSASPADQATSQEYICFFCRSDNITRRHLLLKKYCTHIYFILYFHMDNFVTLSKNKNNITYSHWSHF